MLKAQRFALNVTNFVNRGVVYSISRAGASELVGRGEYYSGSTDIGKESNGHVQHALELNDIHLALKQTCTLTRWTPESDIRSRNEFTGIGYVKDYDGAIGNRGGGHHGLAELVFGQHLVLAAGGQHEAVAVLVDDVDLVAGGNRRTAEAARSRAEALLVQPLSGGQLQNREHAIVVAEVTQAAREQRCLHVVAGAFHGPGNRGAVFGKVARGVGADGEDGPRRPVGAGDDHQAVLENRRRDGNIAAALKGPQLFPGFQIVAADVLPTVDHYLPALGVSGAAAGGVRHHGGGAEGGYVAARRAP